MNRIKELRKNKNVTLQEVSEKTGISIASLSFYEKGQRNPKIETWQKLADYFDVSVGYLQGVVADDNEKKIIDDYLLNLTRVLDAFSIAVINDKLIQESDKFSKRDIQFMLVGIEFSKRFANVAKNDKLLQSEKFADKEVKKYILNQIDVALREIDVKEFTEKYQSVEIPDGDF